MFDVNLLLQYLPQFFDAALLTVELVVLSLVFGFVFAVPLALARQSRFALVNKLSLFYIFFFRGTPLLVQLFLVYYGVSQFESVRASFLWPWLKEPYWCAVIAFSLNSAAYTAEIFRAAISVVPKGELEACKALGFSPLKAFMRLTGPRAFVIALPAYGNEVILMLKASALASTITVMELMGVSRTLNAQTYAPIEMFSLAALFYIALSLSIGGVFKLAEVKLNNWQKV